MVLKAGTVFWDVQSGTGFALPCLKIPYKQPLAEQYMDT